MNKKSGISKDAADQLVKGIRRKTRKQYSAEEKIRIVLAGLRGEESIAALCRREGISESLYYAWSKEFLEAGKQRLAGDTARQATSPEVKELRYPNVYAAPDCFDINRGDHPRYHPVFGAGAHRCLGEALARGELEEALAAFASLAQNAELITAPNLSGISGARSIDAMTARL
jgi:transposase